MEMILASESTEFWWHLFQGCADYGPVHIASDTEQIHLACCCHQQITGSGWVYELFSAVEDIKENEADFLYLMSCHFISFLE